MNKTRPWTAIYPVNMWVLIISLQTFLTQFWPYTSLCEDYIISPLKFVGKYFNLLVEEGGMAEWLLETAGGNKRWGVCPPPHVWGMGWEDVLSGFFYPLSVVFILIKLALTLFMVLNPHPVYNTLFIHIFWTDFFHAIFKNFMHEKFCDFTDVHIQYACNSAYRVNIVVKLKYSRKIEKWEEFLKLDRWIS